MNHPSHKSPDYGDLQELIEELFRGHPWDFKIERIEVVLRAESFDLSEDLLEIVHLLPPGKYSREQLCVQLNSIIGGHAWGNTYGTVE